MIAHHRSYKSMRCLCPVFNPSVICCCASTPYLKNIQTRSFFLPWMLPNCTTSMFHNPHYFVGFTAMPSTCAHTQQLPHHVCAIQWYPHKCRNPHVAPPEKKYPNNGIQMAKFLAIQITPIILDLFNGLEFEPKGDPHHHVAVSEGPSAWLSIKDHIFSK